MTADIIKGPWKKVDPTEKQLEKAQILADCDQIASECVVSFLQSLVENGYCLPIFLTHENSSKIDPIFFLV